MPASQATQPTPPAHAPLPLAQEILFPPLMALEVLSSGVENRLMVVDARLSLNMMSQTLEQVSDHLCLSSVPRPSLSPSHPSHNLSLRLTGHDAQVIGKMQAGHMSLVSTMLGELKHFAPAKALAPLQAVLDNAKRRGLAFFNVRASVPSCPSPPHESQPLSLLMPL